MNGNSKHGILDDMLPIEFVSNYIPIHSISAKSQRVALNFLFTGILLAGAATSGFALAGYLPSWNTYLGISVDLAVAGIILAAHYFKPKRVFEKKLTKQLPIEIKKEFLKYLSLKDLGNAALVCQSWNSAVQTLLPSKLRPVVKSMGWGGEDNVDGLKAYRALRCLDTQKEPKLTEIKLDTNVLYTRHFFSANRWALVGSFSKKFHQGAFIGNATIEVREAHSQKEDFVTCRERSFEDISPTGIGFFGETIYIPNKSGDVILWNYVQDTCEVWKHVHDFLVRKITVTETRIMTYSTGHYKWWKKDLSFIDSKFVGSCSSQKYAVIKDTVFEFTNDTDNVNLIFTDDLTYEDYIIYEKREDISNLRDAMASMPDQEIWKIVVYDTRTKKEETILESKDRSLSMKLHTHILLVQSMYSTIRMYDLEKKKWLPSFNHTGNCVLQGAFAGRLITSNNKDSLKIWDFR